MSLVIEKEIKTVWGLTGLDGYYAYGKKVTSWTVIDTDKDKIVYGGIVSGGITQKGYAKVSRKKDAQLFIDGYLSVFNGAKIIADADFEYGRYIAEFEYKN